VTHHLPGGLRGSPGVGTTVTSTNQEGSHRRLVALKGDAGGEMHDKYTDKSFEDWVVKKYNLTAEYLTFAILVSWKDPVPCGLNWEEQQQKSLGKHGLWRSTKLGL